MSHVRQVIVGLIERVGRYVTPYHLSQFGRIRRMINLLKTFS